MNTENHPKTIFETTGLCCSMKLPVNPITSGSQFHAELMAAKTKGAVIDILCNRGSTQGWFSDMPDGLFDKLQGMRSSSQPKQ